MKLTRLLYKQVKWHNEWIISCSYDQTQNWTSYLSKYVEAVSGALLLYLDSFCLMQHSLEIVKIKEMLVKISKNVNAASSRRSRDTAKAHQTQPPYTLKGSWTNFESDRGQIK